MNDTLANTEKKTAYILTLPAVCLVFAVILFPIFSNIWISFKEVELKDIRIPEPRAKKIVKSISGEESKIKILYKLRNSSLIQEIRDVSFRDKFPKNFEIEELDPRCEFKKYTLKCKFGNWPAKYRENFQVIFKTDDQSKIDKKKLKSIKPKLDGNSDNILLNLNFTLKNFKKVLFENEFVDLLLTTFYYTFLVLLVLLYLAFLLLKWLIKNFLVEHL